MKQVTFPLESQEPQIRHLYTGCSRIYDLILKLYKQQTGKDSTKAIIFSERS